MRTPTRDRLLLTALGAMVAATAAACTEARLTTDPATPSPATARLVLQAAVAGARAGTAVRVVAAYARTGATTATIPMDSQTVALGGGSVSAPLQLNVAPCVADPARELPAGVTLAAATARQMCVLHLAFALLDAGGATLDRAAQTVTTEAGVTTTAPPVTLTAR